MKKRQLVPAIFATAMLSCGAPQASEEGTRECGEHAEHAEQAQHAEHAEHAEPADQAQRAENAEHVEHGGAHHHGFDDPEAWAQRWDNAERDVWQQPEQVIALMQIEPGMSAADIGTGTGYFMPHLVAAVGPEGTVQCLDVEAAMVDYVNRRAESLGAGNASARQVPFDDPQFEAGSVDRVLIVNTWHHIEDRTHYARRVADGLAAGGEVFVVEYDMDAQPGPPLEMRLLPEAVIADFAAAGFEAEVVGTLPRQYVVRARPAE